MVVCGGVMVVCVSGCDGGVRGGVCGGAYMHVSVHSTHWLPRAGAGF